MSRGAPAGWYADPGEPGQLRWWDGAEWAPDTVAPAGDAASASEDVPAEDVPAEDVPAAPVEKPTVPKGEPAVASERPAPAREAAAAPVRPVRAGTVWVWLAIVASVFPFCSALLVDAVTGARLVGYFVLPAGYDPGPGPWVIAGLVLLTWVNGLSLAASVLFAWLDARALRRRGIERPFGWGWAVLVFVATLGVYIVGRTVVVRRRTGRGWAPLWGWLAALVLGLAALALWLSVVVDALWRSVTLGG
ncbi:hypothetical protein BKA24_002596 [Microbacterium marinum]|uniref:DUF2510 domain-containing protein n=1 Tax=Microbacterium marinum TaxID=421115 RepID=A0A7W7BS75_9MICO|nr:hypothetical protein [Microbacterium marinum]